MDRTNAERVALLRSFHLDPLDVSTVQCRYWDQLDLPFFAWNREILEA